MTVEAKELSITRDRRELFKKLSFKLEPGEFLALTGPSGIGKSSLMDAISGKFSDYEGEIKKDGKTVEIPQNHLVVPYLTSYENALQGALNRTPWWRTLLGLFKEEDKDLADKYLKSLELESLIQRPAGKLSGGERQRVAIARALVCRHSIILADEPVSMLDHKLARKTLELLIQEAKETGRSLVCAIHDINLLKGLPFKQLDLSHSYENGWKFV